MTTRTFEMPIVQRRGVHGQPLAPRRAPMMLMEEPVPGGREEPVPSPWERIVGPAVAAPAEASLPLAAATAPDPPTAPEPKMESEVPTTTKVSTVGLSAEVVAAIQTVLDGKRDGDTLVSSEITPLVLDQYESKHGRRLTRAVVQSNLAGRLNEFHRAGLIRLSEDRKTIGGSKTWAVIKQREFEAGSAPVAAAPVALDVQPEPLVQQLEPSTITAASDGERPDRDPQPLAATLVLEEARPGPDPRVEKPLPQEGQPEPEQRLDDLEAAHEQDQQTIATLRQRVAELEDELRLARPRGSLVEFFAQARASGMRVVVEAG